MNDKLASVCLISTKLKEIISPIALGIEKVYPKVFPITDGHLTLLGNIGEGIEDEGVKKELFQKAINYVNFLKLSLKQNPFTLTFTQFYSDPSNPYETLILGVKSNPILESLFRTVIRQVNSKDPLSEEFPFFHASLIYNESPNYPLGSRELVGKIIESQVKPFLPLPLYINIDDCVVMQTSGLPSQWRILE